MPFYEFLCESCGSFEQRREMSRAGEPAPCPDCAMPAQPLISAPNLRRTTPLQRMMLNRNEAGAEPRVSTNPSGQDTAAPPADKPKHSHRHSHRPWMVGH
jgi:putative FmdB family regulatory protein